MTELRHQSWVGSRCTGQRSRRSPPWGTKGRAKPFSEGPGGSDLGVVLSGWLCVLLPLWCKVLSFPVHVRPHMSLYICVRLQTYCPYCRLPLQRCTWLAIVCVCVCVQGTAVPQRYMGRSEGDTEELQLWPWGLWELWLEQCGRGEGEEAGGRMKEELRRFDNFTSWSEMKQLHKKKGRLDRKPQRPATRAAFSATRSSRRDVGEKHVRLRARFQQAYLDTSALAT